MDNEEEVTYWLFRKENVVLNAKGVIPELNGNVGEKISQIEAERFLLLKEAADAKLLAEEELARETQLKESADRKAKLFAKMGLTAKEAAELVGLL